jgi:hypothetical protein
MIKQQIQRRIKFQVRICITSSPPIGSKMLWNIKRQRACTEVDISTTSIGTHFICGLFDTNERIEENDLYQ